MSRLFAASRGVLIATVFAVTPVRAQPPEQDRPVTQACQRMFDWITTEPIRFQASSAILRGSSTPLLERLAEFAHDCPATRIRITGHTDAVGNADFNQRLSEERAATVAEYLSARGVAPQRLVVRGAGASEPVDDNRTAFGRERNRRIDLELMSVGRADTADQPGPSVVSPGDSASNNSTSNTSVESGGIGPRPDSP
jgi:outer membrane protein OmpA-like peptidoglycan-associated protein